MTMRVRRHEKRPSLILNADEAPLQLPSDRDFSSLRGSHPAACELHTAQGPVVI